MTQCTATAKSTGNQCQNDAIKGATVCRVHGGNAPQVKKKARQRLLAAADPAAAELVKIATEYEDVPYADRIRAIKELLNRADLPESKRTELEGRLEGGGGVNVVISEALQANQPDEGEA